MDKKLWSIDTEIEFFKRELGKKVLPTQLFYNLSSGHYAYIPKKHNSEGQVLQSRTTLIGKYTENWAKELFTPIAKELNLYAVNGVVCEELGLTKRSSADLAFCTNENTYQKPEDIKLIVEIKMCIVSNYCFNNSSNIQFIGDYKTHKGSPSLLRSDSMLKAIGKAISIRVSGDDANKIPIIILGNSPITDSYTNKVDFLKTAGVIQGFWSVNPTPTESDFVRETPLHGFHTIKDFNELFNMTKSLLSQNMNYFSSMLPKPKLGEIISKSNQEKDNFKKADSFLRLIREIK